MKKRLMIFDTSMLLVWLQVPGFTRCDADNIGYEEVNEKINLEQSKKTDFVLPLAVLIETGNHISQIAGGDFKRTVSTKFVNLITNAVKGNPPWLVFSNGIQLFGDDKLLEMLTEWQDNIDTLSIGDITIKRIADFYSGGLTDVFIYTCDRGLRAYSPVSDVPVPRRRQK